MGTNQSTLTTLYLQEPWIDTRIDQHDSSELSWATRLVSGMNGSLQVGVGELDYFDRFAKANGDIFCWNQQLAKYVSAYLETSRRKDLDYSNLNSPDYDPSPLITFVQSGLAM